MCTQGWDDIVRAQLPGAVIYVDGNWRGQTCFPVVHSDVLAAIGRLSPLPSLDTWFEDTGRAAGVLTRPQPGIYVRQDRPDLNGRNNDQTYAEGGGAWRMTSHHLSQAFYQEPYLTWRTQDTDRILAGGEP
jgi:hypothetical protein